MISKTGNILHKGTICHAMLYCVDGQSQDPGTQDHPSHTRSLSFTRALATEKETCDINFTFCRVHVELHDVTSKRSVQTMRLLLHMWERASCCERKWFLRLLSLGVVPFALSTQETLLRRHTYLPFPLPIYHRGHTARYPGPLSDS